MPAFNHRFEPTKLFGGQSLPAVVATIVAMVCFAISFLMSAVPVVPYVLTSVGALSVPVAILFFKLGDDRVFLPVILKIWSEDTFVPFIGKLFSTLTLGVYRYRRSNNVTADTPYDEDIAQ